MGTYSKSPFAEAGSASGAGSVSATASAPFWVTAAGFFLRFLPPREPRRVLFFGFGTSSAASVVVGSSAVAAELLAGNVDRDAASRVRRFLRGISCLGLGRFGRRRRLLAPLAAT